MRKRIKICFSQIEQELTMLSLDEKKKYIGGTDDGMNGYGPNGYCLFNSMSYLVGFYTGTTQSYQSYFNEYTNNYGTSGVAYDANGNVYGVESGSASDFQIFFNSHFNTSPTISTAQGMIDSINRNNPMVATITFTKEIVSSGYTLEIKEYHNVVINGVRSDGKFIYTDPTTGKDEYANITEFSMVKEIYGLNPLTYPQTSTIYPPGGDGSGNSSTTLDPYANTTDNFGNPITTDNFGNPITTSNP